MICEHLVFIKNRRNQVASIFVEGGCSPSIDDLYAAIYYKLEGEEVSVGRSCFSFAFDIVGVSYEGQQFEVSCPLLDSARDFLSFCGIYMAERYEQVESDMNSEKTIGRYVWVRMEDYYAFGDEALEEMDGDWATMDYEEMFEYTSDGRVFRLIGPDGEVVKDYGALLREVE